MTEVGDAYIRIHADTRFLRNELRREAREAGKEGGEETGKAFSETLERTVQAEVAKTRQVLAKALVVEDFKDFEKKFGSIRKTVARVRTEVLALQRENAITAKDADKVRLALNDWRVKAEVRQQVEQTRTAIADLEKDIRETIKTTDKMSVAAGRDWRKHAEMVKDVDTAVKRAYTSLSQGIQVFSRETVDQLTRAGEQAGKGFSEGLRRHVDERGSARIFGRLARRISRSFRGIPLLGPILAAPFRAAQGAAALLEGALGGLVSLVSSGGGAFGKFAGTVLAAIGPVGALVIGLAGLTVGLGVLAAAASLAAGAIVALASSLATLVGGALLIAGPLLLALAAAVGTVIIGVKGMSDEQKKALDPITKWYNAIKKPVAERLFEDLNSQVSALGPVLQRANPLLLGMADAIKEVGNEFVIMVGGKEFKEFQRVMGEVLPRITTHLGNAFVSLTSALTGIFTIAAPYAERFSAWLDGVMVKFDTWVHSAEGKNSIRDFLDDAERAGRAVKGVISGIWEVFKDLVGEGNKPGSDMFGGLADSLEDLDEWLDSPEGRDALKQWFEDAKGFAEDLADACDDIIDFLDKLDDPETRKNLTLLLQIFQGLAVAAQFLVGPLLAAAWAINWLGDRVSELRGWIEDINFGDLASKIGGFFSGLASTVGGALSGAFSAVVGFFAGLGSTIGGAISTAFNAVIGFFQALPGRLMQGLQAMPGLLLAWATGLLPGMIQTVALLVTAWAGLAGKMFLAAGDLGAAFLNWSQGMVVGVIDLVARAVTGMIGLAEKMIAAAGPIAEQFLNWLISLPGTTITMALQISSAWIGLAGKMISAAGDIAGAFINWVQSLPGKSGSTASSIASSFLGLAGRMISAAGSLLSAFGTWVSGVAAIAVTAAGDIAEAFSGLAGDMMAGAGDIVSAIGSWLSGVGSAAAGAASDIVGAFVGLGGKIVDAIGSIDINWPSPPSWVPGFATGGIAWGSKLVRVGEAGPEAIIPLYRPLSQVDPSVRAMAALIRGLHPTQCGVAGSPGEASPWRPAPSRSSPHPEP